MPIEELACHFYEMLFASVILRMGVMFSGFLQINYYSFF